MISPDVRVRSNLSEALALTPGGGRIGSLLSGAFDGHFLEIAAGDSRQIPFLTLPGNPQSALAALTSIGHPVTNALLGKVNLKRATVQLRQEEVWLDQPRVGCRFQAN